MMSLSAPAIAPRGNKRSRPSKPAGILPLVLVWASANLGSVACGLPPLAICAAKCGVPVIKTVRLNHNDP